MEVKTDNVFLVQSKDANLLIKQTVIVSDNAQSARECFEKSCNSNSFLGMTALSDYVNVHKNIISSLNRDENAWPLIVDQAKASNHGF
jgi:hypothetical protein